MATENTNPAGGTGGEPGSNANPAGEGGGTAPPTNAGAGEKTFTQADLDRILKERLATEKDRSKRAADEEAARKNGEFEKLAGTEKAARESAEAEVRKLRAETVVLKEAAKANLIDPDAAFILIRDGIEYDADGRPTNIAALLTTLAKEKPYLVKTGDAGGTGAGAGAGAGGGSNPANPGNGNRGGALSLDAIKKMTPQQINADWERVQTALKQGS